jgi:hypothetical protein
MDIKNFVSNNVTLETVKASPTKSLVLLSSGMEKTFQDGKRKICFLTEMDGRQIEYTPNKYTLKLMAQVWGTETTSWIGKKLNLATGTINGKEAVVGSPLAT